MRRRNSVSDAINTASEAASDINATSKAQAFALNAASKAASAKEFDYCQNSGYETGNYVDLYRESGDD